MRPDRYTKVVLTVIAIGLWGLMLTGVDLPDLTARVEATVALPSASASQAGQSGSTKLDGAEQSPRLPPQATLPLVWIVPYVHESNGVNGAYCSTAIILQNYTSSSLGMPEVEWLDDYGNSLGITDSFFLSPGVRATIVADDEVSPFWTVVDVDKNLANFTGSVKVHGDPRLSVAAFEWCRSAAGTAALVAVNNLPAYPVGAALQYFRAGMPATWTPPMAEPESPE